MTYCSRHHVAFFMESVSSIGYIYFNKYFIIAFIEMEGTSIWFEGMHKMYDEFNMFKNKHSEDVF